MVTQLQYLTTAVEQVAKEKSAYVFQRDTFIRAASCCVKAARCDHALAAENVNKIKLSIRNYDCARAHTRTVMKPLALGPCGSS